MKKLLLLCLTFRITVSAHCQIITTIAGDSTVGYNGDGIPAVSAHLCEPIAIALDAEGRILISERCNERIRRMEIGGSIVTIAGTGVAGYSGDGGNAIVAQIQTPYGVAADAAGNIYFVDDGHVCVRKIDAFGIITTIVGTGTSGYNGDNISAVTAQLNGPCGVAVDSTGNVYVVEAFNNRIRKITPSGVITTIAGTGVSGNTGDGGPATEALLFSPYGIALDNRGNLYFSDFGNSEVRKIDNNGIITRFAGLGGTLSLEGFSGDGGLATAAKLNHPIGIAADIVGNVYISDYINNRIRKVDTFGIITTIAGSANAGYAGDGGLATNAWLGNPTGIAVNKNGNIIIADYANDRIRYIQNPVSVQTVYGVEGRLEIYPDPAPSGTCTVNVISAIDEAVQVLVADITGKQVFKATIITNAPTKIIVNQPPGVYLLSATSVHSRWSSKLVIVQ